MNLGKSKTILLVIIAAINLVGCAVANFQPTRQLVDMRAIDWRKVIETDPSVGHLDPSNPRWIGWQATDLVGWQLVWGPYVEIKANNSEILMQGNVHPQDMFFIDLDGDGQEEAIFPLNSAGGTGGSEGVLVYGVKRGVPSLIGVLGGSHVETFAEGNVLVFRSAVNYGFEANCCSSGFAETRYRMTGNRLVAVEHSLTLNPGIRTYVVELYDGGLEAKFYQDVYEQFLSAKFQKANPYEQWRLQYQNTTFLDYKVYELPDGSIGVDYTQTDLTGSGEITRHYSGKWSVVATPNGWRMENPEFKPVD